jgi:hypothetical protein
MKEKIVYGVLFAALIATLPLYWYGDDPSVNGFYGWMGMLIDPLVWAGIAMLVYVAVKNVRRDGIVLIGTSLLFAGWFFEFIAWYDLIMRDSLEYCIETTHPGAVISFVILCILEVYSIWRFAVSRRRVAGRKAAA